MRFNSLYVTIRYHVKAIDDDFCVREERFCCVAVAAIVQCMEAACDLLKNTDGRIAEVSEMVGYQNSNYFSKLFKREKGMTPKEYRWLYRGTSEE